MTFDNTRNYHQQLMLAAVEPGPGRPIAAMVLRCLVGAMTETGVQMEDPQCVLTVGDFVLRLLEGLRGLAKQHNADPGAPIDLIIPPHLAALSPYLATYDRFAELLIESGTADVPRRVARRDHLHN